MLSVQPISAFSDNYIWLLRSKRGKACALVDPGDAGPVLRALEHDGLVPTAILITHHHADHVGGVERLKQHYPQLPVYGPAHERIREISHPLQEGDRVELAELGADFTVMDVPGHTAGHIAYYGDGRLFCGDTLFCCGCGRVFDGSLETLSASLRRIAALPTETLIYCAHEYTLDNIGFAKWVEADNPALLQRTEDTHALISAGRPSVPSTLALELVTNPFLRVKESAVVKAAERWAGRRLTNETEVFKALRTWKDSEYD